MYSHSRGNKIQPMIGDPMEPVAGEAWRSVQIPKPGRAMTVGTALGPTRMAWLPRAPPMGPLPGPHPETLVSLVWRGAPAWGLCVSSQVIRTCQVCGCVDSAASSAKSVLGWHGRPEPSPRSREAQGRARWGQMREQRGFVLSPTPQGGAWVPGPHLSRRPRSTARDREGTLSYRFPEEPSQEVAA